MDGFVGEIRLFPHWKVPQLWLECRGQMLRIDDYPVLFDVISNKHGGDGQQTFALPDLRGRTAVGAGAMTGDALLAAKGQSLSLGSAGGSETVALSLAQIPAHRHEMMADTVNSGVGATPNTLRNSVPSTSQKPANAAATAPAAPAIYGPLNVHALVPLTPDSLLASGGGLTHDNRQPYLPLLFCICHLGIYPTKR